MATKKEIEARGADVQTAVDKGLAQLGLTRNDVIVEVLDEGSRGLLGIGSRDAVVRLTAMVVSSPPPTSKPDPKTGPSRTRTPKATVPRPPSPPTTVARPETAVIDDPQQREDAAVASSIMQTILDHMGLEVEIITTLSEADNLTGNQMTVLHITGDEDLAILIGPRGETLDDLQYLTRLIAGNQLHRRANFSIDVQGYRQRREQALARLAQRMAEKVLNREQAVSLEPMPPNERRIIHMTLRDYEGVYTNSVGEGNQRRVRIYLQE
jgi:spoIIIJ-associated protein